VAERNVEIEIKTMRAETQAFAKKEMKRLPSQCGTVHSGFRKGLFCHAERPFSQPDKGTTENEDATY